MKILSLKAENIKKLIAVEITPNGNMVKITGKNAQGKSSVLDSIWWALGGGDSLPDKPIRDGEEKAIIEIDLGDIIVTRKFSEKDSKKGSTLTVANKDGALYSSPQKMLDNLIGRLSFDPMAFMNLKPAEQFVLLAEHAGVDFSDLDAKRKKFFEQRTDVNRDGKNKKAEVEALEKDLPEGEPSEFMSVSDLAVELNDANENNNKFEQIKNFIEATKSNVNATNKRIKELENEINEEKELLKTTETTLSDYEETFKRMNEINVKEIQDKIKNIETRNDEARIFKKHTEENLILEQLRNKAQGLTDDIKDCDDKREKMIAESKLPVDALSFGDDHIIYNDVPLDQASSAEQLQVSVAVVMAMNPKLRVIRIQDGSLLDSDSMKVISDMAEEKDFQFWVEQVDETGKVGIVIEDGQVVAVNK